MLLPLIRSNGCGWNWKQQQLGHCRKWRQSLASLGRKERFSSEPTNTRYPTLFSSLNLGAAGILPNRALMGSMHTGLEGHTIPAWLVPWLTTSDEAAAIHRHKNTERKLERMASYFQERAQGGVGLMVTGGISPNRRGLGVPFTAKLNTEDEMLTHRIVTEAVHSVSIPVIQTTAMPPNSVDSETPYPESVSSRICMQILHTGRYAYHPFCVSSSNIKARISPFRPRAMTTNEVSHTIHDFVTCAALAQRAGYDGVEIMGSEGYLLSQFLTPRTNPHRMDSYGGESLQDRARMALEIVRQTREATSEDFIIIFRLSLLDLVEEGLAFWEETIELAHLLQEAGTTILNTGVGWHEARVPTIATSVPRGAFAFPTGELKKHSNLHIPIVATNRINEPDLAEKLLRDGTCNMVSMARPFLADPDFLVKAREGKSDEINTCIACNQACLDHVFVGKPVSCLVNPRACHETEMKIEPLPQADRLRISVIGGGPAGCAFAITAAQMGHSVTLYEQAEHIGGQFNMAKRVPGKEEFHETLRYFKVQLEKHGVQLKLGEKVTYDRMVQELDKVDKWVLATGVHPRNPHIPGMEHPNVLSYVDVLLRGASVGEKVAIVGAGGIGFDAATYLLEYDGIDRTPQEVQLEEFWMQWGIDRQLKHRGGLLPKPVGSKRSLPRRQIYLLQRKEGKLGSTLGKTTGWIHKSSLQKSNAVEMIAGVKYERIDEDGNLHISFKDGSLRELKVDNIVVCAGQEPNDCLARAANKDCHVLAQRLHTIGGAYEAGELDAKKAINMGTRLALQIHKEVAPGGLDLEGEAGAEEVLTRMLLRWM